MNEYQENLKIKMDEYARFIYKFTKNFPKEELYGMTSQIRRSGLSIILNYIEGYTRQKSLVRLNFLEIAYGSLKESKYLLYFAKREKYLTQDDYHKLLQLAEKIGAMIWKEIANLRQKI